MMRDREGRAALSLPLAADAVLVAVPSPSVGEGYAEAQRRRMGEGFSPVARTPHPSEFADAPEMPSPTTGERTLTATSLAARSTGRGTRAARLETLS